MSSASGQSLRLTIDPTLDAGLAQGCDAWEKAAARSGAAKVARWLAQRQQDADVQHDVLDTVESLLETTDLDERVMVRAELAEFLEPDDAAVADMLWEGVLEYGHTAGDPDIIFEATTHLAHIAEDHGEPQVAAEYHLAFLNWRRQPDRPSDPDAVESSMEAVAVLAVADGEQQIAAMFEFRLAEFVVLIEAEDPRVFAGDWESDPAPYPTWG